MARNQLLCIAVATLFSLACTTAICWAWWGEIRRRRQLEEFERISLMWYVDEYQAKEAERQAAMNG